MELHSHTLSWKQWTRQEEVQLWRQSGSPQAPAYIELMYITLFIYQPIFLNLNAATYFLDIELLY